MGDDAVLRESEGYVDSLFGEGQGKKHSQFLGGIENDALRETIHRYHALEADTTHLSLEENYLLGMCVLCVTKTWGPAAMFAKTLRHIGVPREKILEAVGRLAMWIGGIQAAEATAHVQKALREFDEKGAESLAAWFPERARERANGGANGG
jgi:alkylhydroperoxidase/carboxymuconolactone decarboxylase family protein YurZ